MWTRSCGPHNDDSFPGPVAGGRLAKTVTVVMQVEQYCMSVIILIEASSSAEGDH